MPDTWTCIRCDLTRDEEFGIHRPNPEGPAAGFRTCPGKVVPTEKVEEARAEAKRRFDVEMVKIARQESGLHP